MEFTHKISLSEKKELKKREEVCFCGHRKGVHYINSKLDTIQCVWNGCECVYKIQWILETGAMRQAKSLHPLW